MNETQMLKDLESARNLIFNVEQKKRKQGFDKIAHSLFLSRANLNDAIYDLKIKLKENKQ